MVWFDPEQSAAAMMVHQLITAWADELDRNEGLAMAPLLAEDCAYTVRGIVRHGREETVRFYRDRLDELNRQPGGPPTQRHAISNLLIDFGEPDKASVTFLLVYYASPHKPPITDFQGPVALADCRMNCSRGADGHWRIASFDSVQSFRRAAS